MPISRFFINPEAISTGDSRVVISDKSIINQIINVLRLRQGDEIEVLDGQGNIFRCALSLVPERGHLQREPKVEAQIKETQIAKGDPKVNVTVALSMLKNDRFEWAIEKMTELGVCKIIPLKLTRTIVQGGGKIERWQTIAKEAAEQCERATIPHIVPPISFSELLAENNFSETETRSFIAGERKEAPHLADVLCNQNSHQSHSRIHNERISIFIGAEGGFTQEELDLACHHGLSLVSLGPRILRAETAAIYALGLIVTLSGP